MHYTGIGYSVWKEVNQEKYWDEETYDARYSDWTVRFLYFIPVKVYDYSKN